MDYIKVMMPNIGIRVPSEKKSSDLDIDKLYAMCDVNIEKFANKLANESYNRIANIAKHEAKDLNLTIVAKYLHYDVGIIAALIQDKAIPNDNRLKQFIDNYQRLSEMLGEKYRKDVSIIENFYNTSKEKSIDEMNADELREYIKTHNIK